MSGRIQIQNPMLVDVAMAPDRVIGVELALRGAFKEEIESLRALTAELDEKLGAQADSESAKQARVDADAYAMKVRGEVESLAARSNEAASKVAAKLSSVEARELAIGAREATVDSRTSELDRRQKAIADAQSTKEAELIERESAVTAREKASSAARDQLSKDQKAFNQRLESLKV